MEFQIVNEISSFWGTLVPPIFLGTVSLLLFLWVIGKENREVLMRRYIDKNKQFVLQKGIYIPKSKTVKHIFVQEFLTNLGFQTFKPLMIIFLVVLVFFGINQLLLQVFQPLLVYYPGQLLYSSGVDDYLIASIWMHYPHVQSSSQLYSIIRDLTGDTRYASNMFQYSVEAFIRFDIVCCMVMLFRMIFRLKKPKWVNMKVLIRLITLTSVLVFALAVVLFSNIQRTNNEARRRCYEAYSILEEKHDNIADLSWDTQNHEIENYLTIIERDKERYGTNLYYGAFGIRNGLSEAITNVVREFYRFFSTQ